MSEKERKKKDGKEKNKENQARRKAESNPDLKQDWSATSTSAQEGQSTLQKRSAETSSPASSSAPAAARAHASKAGKGK